MFMSRSYSTINNEKLSELPAVRPSMQIIDQYQDFLNSKTDTLIKLNKNPFMEEGFQHDCAPQISIQIR